MRGMILAMTMMAAPAAAQTCAPPPALAGWTRPVAPANGAPLAVDRVAALTLVAAPRYALAPAKAPPAGSFGAAAAFSVTAAGTYRVAIGGPAWIDVIQNGKALVSTAHGHGEACAGIAKMVDFALVPGRYILQLSGAKQPAAKVLIARLL